MGYPANPSRLRCYCIKAFLSRTSTPFSLQTVIDWDDWEIEMKTKSGSAQAAKIIEANFDQIRIHVFLQILSDCLVPQST